MQELTDDQLDGLFRKSSEEFDPPYDPAAWQALQSRLDVQQPATSAQSLLRQKLIRWGLPLLLLLLTGSIWYVYQSRSVITNVTRDRVTASANRRSSTAGTMSAKPRESQRAAKVNASVPAPTAQPDFEPAEPVPAGDKTQRPNTQLTGSGRQAEQLAPAPDAKGTSINSPTLDVSPKNDRPVVRRTDKLVQSKQLTASSTRWFNRVNSLATSSAKQPAKPSGERRNTPVSLKNEDAMDNPPGFAKQPVMSATTGNPLTTTPNTNSIDANERVMIPSLTELATRPGQWPNSSGLIDRQVKQPAIAEQPVHVKPAQQRSLSVRFLVSPDLSTIGLRNFQRPGTNVGLLLEYRLASRWSVQTGVMQSTKVYKALTSQYELPTYLANLRVPPESMNGRCSMLDIPVNLRYDVALRPRQNGQVPSRWFVSGGATTYVMRKEDYDYNYPAGTHLYPTTPKGKSESTGQWFKISHLNLSVGYERTLSRRLSWQVEPFLKAPLRGVGYFKINLLSTGAFFSIRYRL